MRTTLPAFTPIEETLYLTLCGRALDNRSAHPILGDTMAGEITGRIGYDCGRFRLSASPVINIAHRARKLDQVAQGFIARHPDAVGLDLGAGLDSRVFRIAPPPGVDWYDVDFPEVIAARRQLLPERAHAHGIGADLTDPDWLDAIPGDRPAVIVADGLMAFLTQDDMAALLNRLIDHFPSGEVAFNGYTRFAIWAARHYHGTQSVADLIRAPGFDDPHEPEHWNPRLKLVREILLTREPEVAEFPTALRLITRLAAHSTALSRRGTTVLHYRFQPVRQLPGSRLGQGRKESPDGSSRTRPGADRGCRRCRPVPLPPAAPAGDASLLVERRPDVSWFPRARNLNLRTLEVFRGLGLEARVIAAGSHVSRMFRKETLASPGRAEFPAVEQAVHIVDHPELLTPEPLMWYCPQSRLEPLLLAAARRRGGDVRYNTELVSFDQDEQGVTATITDRATGTSSIVRADYLAACDGTHSHIRDALGVKAEGLGVLDEHYIFVYFRADWGDLIRGYEADAILIDRPDVRGIFLVTDADRGMFLIQYVPSTEESTQDYTAERCEELIRNGIGKPDLAVEIVDIAHWQPAQLVAEHFQQGRVLLVGDAAHTMPPKLGLGVNTAIQSAQNLAWKLAAVLQEAAAPQLLATYQTERHPVGRLASEQSLVGPAASVLAMGGHDDLLGAGPRVSLFSLIAGYRYRSQAVLAEGTGPPSPVELELLEKPEELTGLPGTRLPHLWVERRGQRISTLDLIDGRFVLLAGPAGTPWPEAAARVAVSLEIDLVAYRLGADGDLLDLEDGWQAKMGMSAEGAVLVRPDGVVAWRTGTLPTGPERRLEQMISSVLCRSGGG